MTASSDDSTTAPPWQFNLRGMFVLIAWVACVTAWAAIRGTGVVVWAVGLSASALNCRGAFACWQFPHPRGAILVYCGWALLIVSLFTPAIRGCGNAPLPGWKAAQAAVTIQSRLPDSGETRDWIAYAYYSTINLANLLLLASPWALLRARRGKARLYAALLGTSSVAVWSAAVCNPQEFLAGYYFWSLSVLCVLSSFRLGVRTLAAMLAFGLGWLIWLSQHV